MGHIKRYGIVIGLAALAALVVAGCGGDDDKGTGSTGLTKEAQFDSLSTFLDFDPGSESEGFDVVSTMLSQLTPSYWDGIDETDFEDLSGFLAPGLSASVTPAAVADTTLSIDYDPVGGWWFVDLYVSESTPIFALTTTIHLKDSVRFEMEDGTPQVVPDEATTYRVRQRASVSLSVIQGSSLNGLQVDLDMTADQDVIGLNATTVVANGTGGYDLDVAVIGQEGAADMSIGMQTEWDDVTFANSTADEVCPTSGQITGGFLFGINVQDGENHFSESGTWNVDIAFTGGGMATVDVESGDFSRSFSGQVCTP